MARAWVFNAFFLAGGGCTEPPVAPPTSSLRFCVSLHGGTLNVFLAGEGRRVYATVLWACNTSRPLSRSGGKEGLDLHPVEFQPVVYLEHPVRQESVKFFARPAMMLVAHTLDV